MNPLQEAVYRRYLFVPESLSCTVRFLANKLATKILGGDWFNKIFDLSDCVFISFDRLRFIGYGSDITIALRPHEEKQLAVIRRLLKPGDTFIDIGAHIGAFTVRAAKIVGSRGRVIAVEPDPRAYHCLNRNVELNGLDDIVFTISRAVYDVSGEIVEFKLSVYGSWSAVTDLHADTVQDTIPVETITLDDLVDALGAGRADMVKIDVEGAEAAVLRGARRVLGELGPILLVEIHGEENGRVVPELLGEYGYRVVYLDEAWEPMYHAHIVGFPRR